MPNLSFRDVTFDVQIHNNQIYITSGQLAEALGYANDRSISKLYNSNVDEFTPGMSHVTESVISGNLKRQTRLFSLRGAHLIAMFSRTPMAKEFRRWVLDVLENETKQNSRHSPVRYLSAEEQSAINQRAHALAQRRYKPLREELMQDYMAGEVDELDKWEPRKGIDGQSEQPFLPTTMTEAEREMAESVFKSRRYLMYFDQDGKPVVYGLEDDQFVTSAEKLPAAIRNAGVSPFNSRQITELLSACVDRLGFDVGRQ